MRPVELMKLPSTKKVGFSIVLKKNTPLRLSVIRVDTLPKKNSIPDI